MSGMIRRLRWKIVGISMLFVTLVLAAVFTGVMLTARSSLEQSSTRQLEKALRGEGYNGQNGQPCFVTEVYSSGTVRVMGSSYYQISEEDLLALVQECLSQQEESGLLTDYHLRYLRYDGALSIRIAFTDSTLEQSALRAMAGNLLLIALAALVVLLGCSYLLSGVAARPVERAWQEQQRFLSDASHELKTPLTVILSSADLLAESAPAEEQTVCGEHPGGVPADEEAGGGDADPVPGGECPAGDGLLRGGSVGRGDGRRPGGSSRWCLNPDGGCCTPSTRGCRSPATGTLWSV